MTQLLERMRLAVRKHWKELGQSSEGLCGCLEKEAGPQRRLDFLSRASAPRRLVVKKTGTVVEVETPQTRQWAEREALFQTLTAPAGKMQTRVELLRQLRAQSPPDLTTDVHHLISREIDFLERSALPETLIMPLIAVQ